MACLFCFCVTNQAEEFAKILRFNFSVGLPVCLDDIGVTREEFEKLIPVIPAMSDLNRYPYKLLSKCFVTLRINKKIN